jgi:DNA-binding transcriptional LysR family regulator
MHRERLTIAPTSTSLYLLPRLLLDYRKQHPQIQIEVYRNISERIPSEVLEQNLDSVPLLRPSIRRLSRFRHRDELVL